MDPQSLGYRMSIELHYLRSHSNVFPECLGDVSEEKMELIHHDVTNNNRKPLLRPISLKHEGRVLLEIDEWHTRELRKRECKEDWNSSGNNKVSMKYCNGYTFCTPHLKAIKQKSR